MREAARFPMPVLVAVLLLSACADPAQDAVAATPEQDQARSGQGSAVQAEASASAPQRTVSLSKLPAGAIALQRAVIEDPGVILRGPALSALVPAGWRTQGGIAAPQSACSEPYVVAWQAQSADGLSALGIFPTEVWQWSTFPIQSACPNRVLRSAREYLTATVQQMFAGARVVEYRPRPDFARSAQENAQRLMQMAQGMGLAGMQARAEGGEVFFTFQRDGRQMHGVAGVTAVFQGSVMRNPLDGSAMEAITGSTLGTFLAFAPEGRLDLDLVEATRRSISPEPRWLQQLFTLQGELGRINAQATAERAAIIVAGGAEATRRNIAAYEQMARSSVQNSRDSIAAGGRSAAASREQGVFPGDAAGDRMQRERIEGIRGVETYHDPVDGRNVQLDANYEHAWRVSGQDAYILTRDPNFNPGAHGIEATQLNAVR